MARFWTRLALLGAILVLLQVAIGQVGADRTWPGRVALERCLSARPDGITFGDSVADHTDPADRDRRGIAALLQDRMPGRKLESITNMAFDPDVFDALIARIAGQRPSPNFVIIPINLRSFSPGWDRAPEYQFRSTKFRARYGDPAGDTLLAPLSALKIYPLNPIGRAEFESTPVLKNGIVVGRLREFLPKKRVGELERGWGDSFVINYLQDLPRDHRKIRSMISIVRRCRSAGIRPFFYVTPVDVETGSGLLGAGFRETVARHVSILRDALAGEGAPLLDLSAELGSSAFSWRSEEAPNEHLVDSGRTYVADRVARWVGSP